MVRMNTVAQASRARSAGASNDAPASLADILDRLEQLAGEGRRVRVGEMMEAFGHRSYGPFLVVPALLELTPLGAVPGVPTALAALIILFAAQIALGRQQMWLPRFVRERGPASEKLEASVEKLRPWARRIDAVFHRRLSVLTRSAFARVAAVLSIGLALTVPALEIFPFASSVPMVAIALFGVALTVRDGALMIGGALAAVAGLALAIGIVR